MHVKKGLYACVFACVCVGMQLCLFKHVSLSLCQFQIKGIIGIGNIAKAS